jgi:hypothetical protein
MAVILSDNFTRGNAVPIGSPYTTVSTRVNIQLLSDLAQASATSSNCGVADTVNSYPNAYYAQCTFGTFTAGMAGLFVRCTPAGDSFYELNLTSGSAACSITWRTSSTVNGTVATPTLNTAATSGDTYVLSVDASYDLTLTQNGSVIGTYNDSGSNIVPGSGSGGFYLNPGATLATATLSSFITGTLSTGLLNASYGPFALAGQAVSFAFNSFPPNLLGAAGAYNLSGAASSSDFQIVAAKGIYAYTGEGAGLVPTISAGPLAGAGSYSIAGQGATLLFLNFQLGATPGNYFYIGGIASLVPVISPVSLLAGASSYSIAAQNADLIFSTALPGFRVEAVTAGVYEGVYHIPGDVFDILTAADYSNVSVNYDTSGLTQLYGWMTEVPQNTPLLQQNFGLMFAGTIAPLQRTVY